MKVPFLKMNGLGNDFVVFDTRGHTVPLDEASVRAIADRRHGVGCDQLITIEDPRGTGDVFMGIRNADGEEVGACGNATRCVGRLLMEETGRDEIAIETLAGTLVCRPDETGNITVDMGEPGLEWQQIPLSEPMDTRGIELQLGPANDPVLHTPGAVNMGNPHCVFFVEDPSEYSLEQIGPMIENHPMFPERANVSLAGVEARDRIRLRVWERGAGITLACGTAACATAVAAARRGLADRKVTILLDGGPLLIEWRETDDHVLMTGPAELSFRGELDLSVLSKKAAE